MESLLAMLSPCSPPSYHISQEYSGCGLSTWHLCSLSVTVIPCVLERMEMVTPWLPYLLVWLEKVVEVDKGAKNFSGLQTF